MDIKKFIVSRDDSVYEAWPDLILTEGGKLICIYTQCKHHKDRSGSRIVMRESGDRGRSWSDKIFLTDESTADDFWNIGRLTRMRDGTLMIVANRVVNEDESERQGTVYLWKGDSEGKSWQGPYDTKLKGIVPDKLLEISTGRWIISVHHRGPAGKLEQILYYSDDKGGTWAGPVTVASDPRYNLCETSILDMGGGTLVSFLREDSWQGYDCFKAISNDSGQTWEGVYNMPIPGCHRPVAGYLQSGRIMIAYRYMQGGSGWISQRAQNFFAALTDEASAKAKNRDEQAVRLIPIDYDRSPDADLGYAGWVQFGDGEIYIVNYIVDDAPAAQIRGYSLYESDFLLSRK